MTHSSYSKVARQNLGNKKERLANASLQNLTGREGLAEGAPLGGLGRPLGEAKETGLWVSFPSAGHE